MHSAPQNNVPDADYRFCCLADKLFRINNVGKRKKYADLVEGVREAGGEALVFSSMHVSGEQLNNLSGIAAVLRFPLPELEDQELVEEV